MTGGDLYLDTSCLLKLFFSEPESASVAGIVSEEPAVVVSSLGVLEASVQIHGRRVAGSLSRARAERLEAALEQTLSLKPFRVVPFTEETIEHARAQARAARKTAYCGTLDRLHLCAMELFGLHRLFTNDERQAVAGRALGFAVTMPRATHPSPPKRHGHE